MCYYQKEGISNIFELLVVEQFYFSGWKELIPTEIVTKLSNRASDFISGSEYDPQ